MRNSFFPAAWVALLLLSSVFTSCDLASAEGTTTEPSIEISYNSVPLSSNYSHNSGSAFPGTPGSPAVFTVKNTGPEDIDLGSASVKITGADASLFTLTAPSKTLLASGQSTNFSLTFSPVTPGVKSASVTIETLDPPLTAAFTITGTAPILKISRLVYDPDTEETVAVPILPGSTLDLGTSDFDGEIDWETFEFTVENLSTGAITFSAENPYILLSGENAGEFTLYPLDMTGGLSASGTDFFDLEYDFSAFDEGVKSVQAAFPVQDFPADYSFTVKLTAKGMPIIDLLDFEDLSRFNGEEIALPLGDSTFKISNMGNGALTVSSIKVSGSDEYELPDLPSLPAKVRDLPLEFTVRRNTEDAGSYGLTITTDDEDDSPFIINLSGIASGGGA